MKETKVPKIESQKKLPIVVLNEDNKVVYGDWVYKPVSEGTDYLY